MLALITRLLSQFSPEMFAAWERIGIVGFLVAGIAAMAYMYRQKSQECEEERDRADSSEQRVATIQERFEGIVAEERQKYVDLLKQDIEERKARDQTLELLSKVARGKKANGNGE